MANLTPNGWDTDDNITAGEQARWARDANGNLCMVDPDNEQQAVYVAQLATDAFRKVRGNVHTKRPWHSATFSGITAGYTVHNVIALESLYDAVRLCYSQINGLTTSGIKACIAPSAKVNNYRDPVDDLSASAAWSNVTFNNSGANGNAPSPAGSTVSSGTIPAGSGTAAAILESHYFSDWIPTFSYARGDSGETFPLLFMRNYFPNAQAYGVNPGGTIQGDWINDPSVHDGRIITSAIQSVDGVSTPANFTNGAKDQGWIGASAIQYISRYRGLSVHAIGDSITRGQSTQGNKDSGKGFRPWGHIACKRMSRLDRPVTFANWGISGQTTPNTIQRHKAIIENYSPDVVFIWPYSLNDGPPATMAAAANGMFQARAAIQLCLANGAIPVICTATPGALTGAAETVRQAVNDEVRNWYSTGLIICDFDAAIRDPYNISQMKQALRFDNWHPNEAGHEAMADVAQAALQKVFDYYF